ncbi:MAG: hypothetical protein Q9187_002321 [Circinaria calcarea]
MASEHVLRIPCGEDESKFVLVNVISVGPAEFDLKLIGTEGISPYVAIVKNTRIQRLRTKHSPVDEAEWETLLRATLLQQRIEGAARVTLGSIEVVATIDEGQIIVAVRRNISGITQRLGEIVLKKDEDQEIDTITWVATAVARSQALEQEADDLRAMVKEQGELVRALNKQLEDLGRLKTDHENALLYKFRELLNAKKLKIRNQQRLLATAKVNQSKGSSPQSALHGSNKRKPTSDPSRSTTDSEDAAFGDMKIDTRTPSPEVDDANPGSPEKSDSEVTSDEL